MSLSRLVATSRRPSLGHVVYTLVTVAMTDAEFKLNMYENFENWNFMPQVSGIKLRHFLMLLADYSLIQRTAKPNRIIGKHEIR